MRRRITDGLSIAIVASLFAATSARAEPPVEANVEPHPAPPVVSFDEAIRQAMARNPQAQVAVLEIRRAQALVEETRAGALPSLAINGVYTRLDSDRTLNGNVVAPADSLNANIQLTVPIVQAQRWAQWSHAQDNVEVARFSAVEVRRQLAITVARTYVALVTERRLVEIANRAIETARLHYDFAHQRFAAGYGTRIDEVRAAQELAGNRAQIESLKVQLSRLEESLGVLLGRDGPATAAPEFSLPGLPASDEAAHDAESLRADVLLSRRRLRAAERISHDDYADYLPSLASTFQGFYQAPRTLTIPPTGWQLQLLLTVPLYDGGLRYGLAHERHALETEARLSLEGGIRQAQSDVRVGFEEVRHAAAAVSIAREAAQLAADNLKLVNLGYQGGASTSIEVVDAERRARDADTAVAQAEDTEQQAKLDLLIASGRFPASP